MWREGSSGTSTGRDYVTVRGKSCNQCETKGRGSGFRKIIGMIFKIAKINSQACSFQANSHSRGALTRFVCLPACLSVCLCVSECTHVINQELFYEFS
jgi:hypothetical protein